MNNANINPTKVTLSSILKACSSIAAIQEGMCIHDFIIKSELEMDVIVGGSIVNMYAKCGALAKAKRVHDGLCVRDVVSWSALIAGYAQQGKGREALKCYETMQGEGLSPDAVTFICILKACSSTGALDKGIEIHEYICRERMWEQNTQVCNALMDMYGKFHAVLKVQEVFDQHHLRDAVTWNILISGYCQPGHEIEALSCFEEMKTKGFSPDPITFSCALAACANLKELRKGKRN